DLLLVGRDHLDLASLRADLERDRPLHRQGRASAALRLGCRVTFVGVALFFAEADARQPDRVLPVQLVHLDVVVAVLVRFDLAAAILLVLVRLIWIAVVRHRLREQLGKVDLQVLPVPLQLVPVPASRLPIRLGGSGLRQDRGGKQGDGGHEHGSNHGIASSESCTTSRRERRYPAYPSRTRIRTFTSSAATARDSPSCARARVSVSSQRRAISGSSRGRRRAYSA